MIATPKHYAVHSGPESTRHEANVDVSPYDLWDTYLPAFRATITEARADSIMCAYNSIDGQPACANTMLLKDILRNDWKFPATLPPTAAQSPTSPAATSSRLTRLLPPSWP